MPLSNLCKADTSSVTFVHFNVAAILYGAIPTYGVLVHNDRFHSD